MSDSQVEKPVQGPDATFLALERTRLAYERTQLAWVRTATGLITFGFTIYKFFEYQHQQTGFEPHHRLLGPREYAVLMIGAGLITLFLATLEHRNNMRKLRELGPIPRSLAGVLAALISVLGIVGFLAAIFRE